MAYRLFLFLLLLWSCSGVQKPEASSPPQGSEASAHPLAAQAGMKILEQGGNAFDAAIAVAATLNVVEPMMSGLGGYGTILVYDAKSKQQKTILHRINGNLFFAWEPSKYFGITYICTSWLLSLSFLDLQNPLSCNN